MRCRGFFVHPTKRMTAKERGTVLWGRRDTAAFLGVSLPTLDKLPLPRIRLGKRLVRFDPAAVRAWALLNSHPLTLIQPDA